MVWQAGTPHGRDGLQIQNAGRCATALWGGFGTEGGLRVNEGAGPELPWAGEGRVWRRDCETELACW